MPRHSSIEDIKRQRTWRESVDSVDSRLIGPPKQPKLSVQDIPLEDDPHNLGKVKNHPHADPDPED